MDYFNTGESNPGVGGLKHRTKNCRLWSWDG